MKSFVTLICISLLSGVAVAQAATAPTHSPVAGSWKIDGNVEGVPVLLTCALVESEKILSGSCTSDDGAIHTLTGKVQEKVVTWVFDSAYQGQAITVTLSGTIDATGLKMTGSIAVDPLQVDGAFTAAKQPAVVPAATAKSTATI